MSVSIGKLGIRISGDSDEIIDLQQQCCYVLGLDLSSPDSYADNSEQRNKKSNSIGQGQTNG